MNPDGIFSLHLLIQYATRWEWPNSKPESFFVLAHQTVLTYETKSAVCWQILASLLLVPAPEPDTSLPIPLGAALAWEEDCLAIRETKRIQEG